jgi:hypothetical protein
MGRVLALCLCVSASACSLAKSLGRSSHSKNSATGDNGTRAAGRFVRVEDLPPAYQKVDDLAPAPPVAVRPLRGPELTPKLVRRAEDVLHNQEAPLGTQVVVEMGDKRYIARFEWHYHDELSMERPFGWHKGVTLYTTE